MECAWRNTHANCHWLVLLTLEGDWALRRDPISQSLWRYVERDWLIGNPFRPVSWHIILPVRFSYFGLHQYCIILPGRLFTQSLTILVLRPLFQIASSCFGCLSVHCGCYTETRYANVSYPMTETHILKYKTVNLAYLNSILCAAFGPK